VAAVLLTLEVLLQVVQVVVVHMERQHRVLVLVGKEVQVVRETPVCIQALAVAVLVRLVAMELLLAVLVVLVHITLALVRITLVVVAAARIVVARVLVVMVAVVGEVAGRLPVREVHRAQAVVVVLAALLVV
jgi:hypothetical protein